MRCPLAARPNGGSSRVSATITPATGAGVPLPATTRAFFEPRLGQDLSNVRIHADPQAGRTAEELGAQAYTMGTDIVFAPGQLSPGTDAGQRLLAHELVHVVQNRRAPDGAPARLVSDPEDHFEAEAERNAVALLDGRAPRLARSAENGPALISRQPAPTKAKRFQPGQFVLATTAFALMDKLGGEKGQKKVKQIAKGDLLRIEDEAVNGGGLAWTVTVMKNETEPELGPSGERQVGVASVIWIAPAPEKPKPAAAKSETAAMDLPGTPPLLEDCEINDDGTVVWTRVSKRDNFVDRRTQAVGLGLLQVSLAGYALFVDGSDKPIILPEEYVQRGATSATPVNEHVYDDRDEALAAVAAAGGGDKIAYYKAAAGLIVPTIFSPASTPRILDMIERGWQTLVDEVNTDLVYLAISIVGSLIGKVVIRKLMRWSSEGSEAWQAKQLKIQQDAKAQIKIMEDTAKLKNAIVTEPFATTKVGRDLFFDVRDRLARADMSGVDKANTFEEAAGRINKTDPSWSATRGKAVNAVGFFTGEARPFGIAFDKDGGVWGTLNFTDGTTMTKDGWLLDYSKWKQFL